MHFKNLQSYLSHAERLCFKASVEPRINHIASFLPECNEPVRKIFRIIAKYLYGNHNRHHDHTGASSYAEYTQKGLGELIKALVKHGALNIPNFRVVDAGAGLFTSLVQMAQLIPGEYLGIEYCSLRSYMFAKSFLRMIAMEGKNLPNHKIAYCNQPLQEFTKFDADFLHAFDEAMTPDVCFHIVSMSISN